MNLVLTCSANTYPQAAQVKNVVTILLITLYGLFEMPSHILTGATKMIFQAFVIGLEKAPKEMNPL